MLSALDFLPLICFKSKSNTFVPMFSIIFLILFLKNLSLHFFQLIDPKNSCILFLYFISVNKVIRFNIYVKG